MGGTTLLLVKKEKRKKCPLDITPGAFVILYDPSSLLKYRNIVFRGVLPNGAVVLEKKGQNPRLDLREAVIIEGNRGWYLKEKDGGESIAIRKDKNGNY